LLRRSTVPDGLFDEKPSYRALLKVAFANSVSSAFFGGE